jgi:hypothetical protein
VSEYLTCPLCNETDYDRIGLAMHYSDCEVAQELATLEHKQSQERARQYIINHPEKFSQELVAAAQEVSA